MIWRLFKGRKAATESVVAETPAERLEQPSGERPKKLTPRLSAFRFEAPSRLGEEVASDTDIQEVAPSPPEHDFSSIVREKARKRRSVRVSDRGVRPMLVPSLRESTTRFKVIATKLSERKPTEAMHYWQDYLELRPQDADAWFSMGRCCLHLGYADEAQHAFQKTVNLDNEHSLAFGALGYQLNGKRIFHVLWSCTNRLSRLMRETLVWSTS